MLASAKVLTPATAVSISKDTLEDYMSKSSKKWTIDYGSSDLVAVRAWYEDGKNERCGQGCFHSIRDPRTTGMVTLCAWIMPHSCGYTTKLTDNEAIYFLGYLANESPYQAAFLCKDAKLMWDLKTMAFDVSCPGNLMVGGMIAARSVYHGLPLVRTFLSLAKGGMNKDLALFIATGTQFKASFNKQGFDIRACNSQGYSGHAHLSTNSFDLQSLWNFLDHDPKFLTPPFTENNKYYGLHITFLGDKYRGIKEVPFNDYSQSVHQANLFVQNKTDRANDYLSKLYKSGGVSTPSIHNIFSSVKVFVPESDLGYESLEKAVPKLVVAGEQVMKDFQQHKEKHK